MTDTSAPPPAAAAAAAHAPPSWHSVYPAPISTTNWLPRETAKAWLLSLSAAEKESGSPVPAKKDFLLVDLRRMDHAVRQTIFYVFQLLMRMHCSMTWMDASRVLVMG